MSTKYPQGLITPTPPFKSTTAKSFSGVWTLEQLAKNFYYYTQAVPKSLRFRSSASAYLNRTPSVAGNQNKWTWSGWIKRGTLGANQYFFLGKTADNGNSGTVVTGLSFTSSDNLEIYSYTYGTGVVMDLITTQVFRDPSAWYHIEVAIDTTQATANNRAILYVNGVQVTSFSTATYPTQNSFLGVNAAFAQRIGVYVDSVGSNSLYFDGYLAEVNFIDGQALDPSYFGQVSPITGVWSPAKYVGSYGTNGFYLKFTDTTSTTTLCYDYSGNGNNWTPNNISLTSGSTYDSMLDSPTNYDNGGNGVGNYAVLNPLNGNLTLSGANLNVTDPNVSYAWRASTIAVSSGKWYFEYTNTQSGTIRTISGATSNTYNLNSQYLGTASIDYGFIWHTGEKFNNGTATSYGTAVANSGDIIMTALDMDNGKIWWGVNGVWYASGDPVAGTNPAFTGVTGTNFLPVQRATTSSGTYLSASLNHGQRPFAYTPPTGFNALNTQNLPAASIVNGASYMAATTYTGTGSSLSVSNSVNSVSFQPDFIWFKSRSSSAYHALFDVVRGRANGLASNATDAEATSVNAGDNLVSFDANGFTVGSVATAPFWNSANGSGLSLVAWQWKAGGTAVTNTAGSITSQVSANTTAGFSVVTYTGNGSSSATVGHGLGVIPAMVVTKGRSGSTEWMVKHQSLPTGQNLILNQTIDAPASLGFSQGVIANLTSASNFGFTSGSSGVNNSNQSGVTYVAYCFAAIPGYSAFGSYTGNGSSDGPFVFLGFRPRFVLVKGTAVSSWYIWDSSRGAYNVINETLYPNLSNAEGGSGGIIDFLSNGFKIRTTGSDLNTNGNTMIYAAFAENPLKFSLAR